MRYLAPISLGLCLCFPQNSYSHEIQGFEVLEAMEKAITELSEKVTPTVVNITPIRDFQPGQGFQRRTPYTQGSGSGVILSEDGIIVTNNHVIGFR